MVPGALVAMKVFLRRAGLMVELPVGATAPRWHHWLFMVVFAGVIGTVVGTVLVALGN